MSQTLDRVEGMLAGLVLGDALGAPHEFRCNRATPYTGVLEHVPFHYSRWQGRRELPVAHWTDDTEMSLALLHSILKHGAYLEERVVLGYLAWANSGQWYLGQNTRALMRGVKTSSGFRARQRKVFRDCVSQSNGFLMRASGLALLGEPDCVIRDVNLTNPDPDCRAMGQAYVAGLRSALLGASKNRIIKTIYRATDSDVVKQLARDRKKPRALVPTPEHPNAGKGWARHAFWTSLHCLEQGDQFAETMRWIIQDNPGSDTDTNAAIAGALLGAHYGYQALVADPIVADNLARIEQCPSQRPSRYQPKPLLQLAYRADQILQRSLE